jgi:hypothetical protein
VSASRHPVIGAVLAVIGLALLGPATALARPSSLERGLLEAVRAVRLDEVVDFGPSTTRVRMRAGAGFRRR